MVDRPDEPGGRPLERKTPDAQCRTPNAEYRTPRIATLAAVAGLLASFAIFAIISYRLRLYTLDDAFISLRYARNLAKGHGIVFNAGERVEGYTNFLWVVILAAPFLLRVDPVAFAHAAD